MTKSVITIEKEFYEENGIPMVRRIVKENDVLLAESSKKISDRNFHPIFNDIEEWIADLKWDVTENLNDVPENQLQTTKPSINND